MSHIRNLLHKPSGHIASRPASSVVVAGEPTNLAAVTTIVPEFPVEQAHINPGNRLICHVDPSSSAADRFRFLRMHLREHWSSGKLKKLLITSPLAHDGKSTILLNLATALAERGKRSVAVVEADLHHASLVTDLKLNTWAGLTDCIQDDTISPLSNIRRIEPLGWHFLPAGEPRRNPTEVLQNQAVGKIIQKISVCFDWVLIDSPPVVLLTDAIALQQHVDATLLVVKAGQTPREAIVHSISVLGMSKIVGVVLNGVERRNQPAYQQRYYGGGRHYED